MRDAANADRYLLESVLGDSGIGGLLLKTGYESPEGCECGMCMATREASSRGEAFLQESDSTKSSSASSNNRLHSFLKAAADKRKSRLEKKRRSPQCHAGSAFHDPALSSPTAVSWPYPYASSKHSPLKVFEKDDLETSPSSALETTSKSSEMMSLWRKNDESDAGKQKLEEEVADEILRTIKRGVGSRLLRGMMARDEGLSTQKDNFTLESSLQTADNKNEVENPRPQQGISLALLGAKNPRYELSEHPVPAPSAYVPPVIDSAGFSGFGEDRHYRLPSTEAPRQREIFSNLNPFRTRSLSEREAAIMRLKETPAFSSQKIDGKCRLPQFVVTPPTSHEAVWGVETLSGKGPRSAGKGMGMTRERLGMLPRDVEEEGVSPTQKNPNTFLMMSSKKEPLREVEWSLFNATDRGSPSERARNGQMYVYHRALENHLWEHGESTASLRAFHSRLRFWWDREREKGRRDTVDTSLVSEEALTPKWYLANAAYYLGFAPDGGRAVSDFDGGFPYTVNRSNSSSFKGPKADWSRVSQPTRSPRQFVADLLSSSLSALQGALAPGSSVRATPDANHAFRDDRGNDALSRWVKGNSGGPWIKSDFREGPDLEREKDDTARFGYSHRGAEKWEDVSGEYGFGGKKTGKFRENGENKGLLDGSFVHDLVNGGEGDNLSAQEKIGNPTSSESEVGSSSIEDVPQSSLVQVVARVLPGLDTLEEEMRKRGVAMPREMLASILSDTLKRVAEETTTSDSGRRHKEGLVQWPYAKLKTGVNKKLFRTVVEKNAVMLPYDDEWIPLSRATLPPGATVDRERFCAVACRPTGGRQCAMPYVKRKDTASLQSVAGSSGKEKKEDDASKLISEKEQVLVREDSKNPNLEQLRLAGVLSADEEAEFEAPKKKKKLAKKNFHNQRPGFTEEITVEEKKRRRRERGQKAKADQKLMQRRFEEAEGRGPPKKQLEKAAKQKPSKTKTSSDTELSWSQTSADRVCRRFGFTRKGLPTIRMLGMRARCERLAGCCYKKDPSVAARVAHYGFVSEECVACGPEGREWQGGQQDAFRHGSGVRVPEVEGDEPYSWRKTFGSGHTGGWRRNEFLRREER